MTRVKVPRNMVSSFVQALLRTLPEEGIDAGLLAGTFERTALGTAEQGRAAIDMLVFAGVLKRAQQRVVPGPEFEVLRAQKEH